MPHSFACAGVAGVVLACGICATGAFAQSLPKVPSVSNVRRPVTQASPPAVADTVKSASDSPAPGSAEPPLSAGSSMTIVDVQVGPGPAAAELLAVVEPAVADQSSGDEPAPEALTAMDPPAEDAPTAPAPVAIDQDTALELATEAIAPPAPAKGTFNASLVFQQSDPTNDVPETAGVQTASVAPPDRTAIVVAIAPPANQMTSTIFAILPSTGGPSSVALASALLGLCGVGVWLRRSGRTRR